MGAPSSFFIPLTAGILGVFLVLSLGVFVIPLAEDPRMFPGKDPPERCTLREKWKWARDIGALIRHHQKLNAQQKADCENRAHVCFDP